MFKQFSAFILSLSFLTAFPAYIYARGMEGVPGQSSAQESSGSQANGSATSNPGEPALNGGEFAIPSVSPSTHMVSENEPVKDPSQMSDMEIFKNFYAEKPLLAATAMLNTMDDIPGNELNDFQDYFCNQIAEMIVALDTKSKSGEISQEEYTEITMRLGGYGLYTLQTDAYGVSGGGEMTMGMMSIDTIPLKPGVEPRPWPSAPLPQNSGKPQVKPGSAMSQALQQATLIPPQNGQSAQLVPPNGGKPVELNPVMALIPAHKAARDGDMKGFQSAISRAESYFPSKPRVQIAAASLYYETGNFKKAETAATRAIGLSKNDPDAYKARALARSAMNDRKGAIEDVNKAVAINPQDESARLLTLLIDSRKPVKSFKTVSSLQGMKRQLGIKTDSRDAARSEPVKIETAGVPRTVPGTDGSVSTDYAKSKAHTKTAQARNRLGDYEGAVSYASLALEKDPDNLEAYMERANAYNSMGKYEDVIRDTTYVIGKDENNMQAFNLRSWALNHIDNPNDAANDAERAIGINPNFADSWFNHGLAAEKQGDYKRMLEDFKQAAALNESYSRKYQDALAQYGGRVPGFSASAQTQASDLGGEVQEPVASPVSRYFMLLIFMLVGGALIAVGLAHVLTGSSPKENRGGRHNSGNRSSKGIISPAVFYEGVATGKYKIEKKIGEGAMGKVYLAVDKSLGRKVAIKKMNDEIKVNEREKQRFLDEARTVALLHHPNIVEIYTIFEESGDVFLVFEYLEGRTLDTVLNKDIRMSFNRVKGIYEEVAKALDYAHSKGVVHRDLKLSNIMLTAEGYVKVMDFGLAGRAIEAKVNSGNREVVGSPAYMAPEQENGNSSVRSDIYSLGICIYESLTGVLPFQGPDFSNQKMRNFYEPVSQCVPGLPRAIDTLIEKCLDVDPEKRFASAEEFRKALASIHA